MLSYQISIFKIIHSIYEMQHPFSQLFAELGEDFLFYQVYQLQTVTQGLVCVEYPS